MTPERILAVAATVVIVAAVIAGLLLTESPLTARAERFDTERLRDLNTVANVLDDYYWQHHVIPEDLSIFATEYDFEHSSTDPRTGEPYEFERVSDLSYRLCATFETNGPHVFDSYPRAAVVLDSRERYITPGTVEGVGRQCFEVSFQKAG